MSTGRLPPVLPPVLIGHPHVEIKEEMGGSPIVQGSRVPVRRLWAWHRKGVSVETLVKRYPSLGWAKVLGALSFAYDNEELIEADLDRERALLETKDPDPVPGRMEQTRLQFDPSGASVPRAIDSSDPKFDPSKKS